MNTKFRILLIIGVAVLFGFTSCQKQNYKLGPFSTPTSLQLTANIIGKTDTTPNGDGSGRVVFNVTAKDAATYKIDFGNGAGPSFVTSFPDTVTYAKVGTFKYGVTVTAYAVANAAPTVSTSDSVSVYYSFKPSAEFITMLTENSASGKQWMVDSAAVENMGIGPDNDFTPDYYSAAPGDKSGAGLYTSVYTFTDQNEFVDSTHNTIFGRKEALAGIDPSLPGYDLYGNGTDYTLYYPTYSVKFSYAQDPASASNTGVIINFAKPGSVGYYVGTHEFEVLDITDTTMLLRTLRSDLNLAYYVKLKAKK